MIVVRAHFGDDDTRPFKDVTISVISLHSVSQDKFPALQSKADNLDAVLPEELYQAYRTVTYYLAYLDTKLPWNNCQRSPELQRSDHTHRAIGRVRLRMVLSYNRPGRHRPTSQFLGNSG